jgi:hypothetical protein
MRRETGAVFVAGAVNFAFRLLPSFAVITVPCCALTVAILVKLRLLADAANVISPPVPDGVGSCDVMEGLSYWSFFSPALQPLVRLDMYCTVP